MYKIGEFSKITHLTIKTLRYYDEQKILIPSYRTESKYRLYNQEDFKKAELIICLKNLDFSITEIKEVLENCKDKEDLRYFLEEKKQFIYHKIEKQKSTIEQINHLLTPNANEEENKIEYVIQMKQIPSIRVACIRYQGKYNEVGKYIGQIYQAIKGKQIGEPFNLYYDTEYKEIADIELCIPIQKTATVQGIEVKTLPEIRALSTIHIGSYERLNHAYKAILDYASNNQFECLTPSREIYYKGPGMIFKGNINKYKTEILLPIRKEEDR